MRTSYDAKVDALFVHLAEFPTYESEEVAPGVIFDLDEDGRLVRIERLNASEKGAAGALATAAEQGRCPVPPSRSKIPPARRVSS